MTPTCSTCGLVTAPWHGPFETRFDVLLDHLTWNDGPLWGIAKCKMCAQAFAFKCLHHRWNEWIEWHLCPIERVSDEPEYMYEVEARSTQSWLKVNDDQRPDSRQSSATWVMSAEEPLAWHVPR